MTIFQVLIFKKKKTTVTEKINQNKIILNSIIYKYYIYIEYKIIIIWIMD